MANINNNVLYKEDISSILSLNCDWMTFKNKVFLITGATGLIGTVLIDMLLLLNKKFELNMTLLLISRHEKESKDANVIYIKHDICNTFDYASRIDYIIHLASNTHPQQYAENPVETITTNIFGTYNLLNLAKNNSGCRFLSVSSVEIYGENKNPNKIEFSENDMGYLNCNTARAGYCESKRTAESLCQSFHSQYGVDFVTARLCRCYGPTLKADDTKALSQFLRNALNKQNIVLKSDGCQYYSYLYASDAASALLYLLLKGETGEAYNVSDKNSDIHLKDLAQLIAVNSNTEVIFELPNEIEKKGFSKATTAVLDSKKINELGWHACYTIQQGISRTLRIMQ